MDGMSTYTMVCDMQHEPQTLTVMGSNDDEAMTKMMEEARKHFGDKHPDMKMTDEELMDHIKTHWKKS